MSFARKILCCFLLFLALWAGGLFWFLKQIPTEPLPDPARADAIVVLTGSAGRLEYGIDLFLAGRAKALFISGAGKEVSYHDVVQRTPPKERDSIRQATGKHIMLGNQAENTIGNAQETSAWLRQKNHASILLVTANYHMPRSISEFAEAMPDVRIIPAPIFPNVFTLGSLFSDTAARQILLSEYHKYLAGKLRHWLMKPPLSPLGRGLG